MEVNNYPSWLVSVGQAKRLKEIGFDIPCAFVLTNKDKIGFTTNESNQYHLFEELDLNSNSESSLVCIPTYEQVFEWFREKGFRIFLENHEDSTKFMFYNMGINEGKHFKGEYSNYEEAREALVKELIQTYKREQL